MMINQSGEGEGGAVDFRGPLLSAAIAQLGERQTEDLKVPGSIPGRGNPEADIVYFLVDFSRR